jgi:16S rRNA processing protein RimM
VFVGERAYSIASAEPIAEGWLVKLDGVDDRDAAEALRGQALTAPRDELPPPGPDEVYLSDLVGCAVVDREGAAIGSVSRVVDSGAQELLVVTRPDGREALVPFIAPIVVSVDEAGRRIVCDPPEGLLDL